MMSDPLILCFVAPPWTTCPSPTTLAAAPDRPPVSPGNIHWLAPIPGEVRYTGIQAGFEHVVAANHNPIQYHEGQDLTLKAALRGTLPDFNALFGVEDTNGLGTGRPFAFLALQNGTVLYFPAIEYVPLMTAWSAGEFGIYSVKLAFRHTRKVAGHDIHGPIYS